MNIHKFSYFVVHDVIIFGNVRATLWANNCVDSTLKTQKQHQKTLF